MPASHTISHQTLCVSARIEPLLIWSMKSFKQEQTAVFFQRAFSSQTQTPIGQIQSSSLPEASRRNFQRPYICKCTPVIDYLAFPSFLPASLEEEQRVGNNLKLAWKRWVIDRPTMLNMPNISLIVFGIQYSALNRESNHWFGWV